MNRPLTISKAAEYVGVSLATFNRRKAAGLAPEPANPGEYPAIYMTDDLDAWMARPGAVDRRKTRWARERAARAQQAPLDIMA